MPKLKGKKINNYKTRKSSKIDDSKTEKPFKKKHKCEVCNYETDRLWSFNKHLGSEKHMKLTRVKVNLKMDIVKCESNKYSIPVYKEFLPEMEANLKNSTIDFIYSLTNEIKELKEENLLLTMNMQNTFNMDDNYREFDSIFDNDFSKLFGPIP